MPVRVWDGEEFQSAPAGEGGRCAELRAAGKVELVVSIRARR